MEMIFTSARGTMKMDGGGGNSPFKILSAEGLGYMAQNASTVSYPFSGGQKTLSRSPGARLITISAEAAEGGANYEGTLAAIAHDSGRLEIIHGEKRVYAQCYISNLNVTRAKGSEYERYVLQFTCDYPYFRESVPDRVSLFERKKLLTGKFTLPMVFSERITEGRLTVRGDRDVYPHISVRGLSYDEEFPLEIVSETTGAVLRLVLPAGKYELITFDLWNGRIYCGQNDLTKYLDDESFMSDFYLVRGENHIEIRAMDVSVNTSASVSFENEYFSAWEDRDV